MLISRARMADPMIMQSKIVLDLCNTVLVCCVSEKDIAINLVESDTSKKTIKIVRAPQSQASGNRPIVNQRDLHRSPGHQVDDGS
jgi:hypothetical protein